MADAGQVPPRRRWLRRAALGVLALLVAMAAVLLGLDTSAGHRFLIDRIAAMERDDGLTIRIGRIDGSLYRGPMLRDVRLGDPQGQFLTVGEARLDWRPWDFLWLNRLNIDRLIVPRADLTRLPKLRDTDDDKPLLPDFDIRIGALRVERLDIGERVAGRAHVAIISGDANVRSGAATVHLDARLRASGDRVRLTLVAEPERGDFDLDSDLAAPAGGVLAALMGSDTALSAVIRGAGNWHNWRGSLLARSDGTTLASIRLAAREGRFTAIGRLWPEARTSGIAQRLSAGGVALDVDGRITERRWDGRASLVSPAAQAEASGQADFANQRFGAMRIDARLRDGSALAEGLSGEAVLAALLLEGDFAAPRYEYRLSAAGLAWGKLRLSGVEARGRGTAQRGGFTIPVALRIAQSSGVSSLLDRHLGALRADGSIGWRSGVLSAENIRIAAAGLSGRLGVRMANGARDVTASFDGAIPGLELGKVGRADLILAARGARTSGGPLSVNGIAR
ncbi:MAG: hypothetical protein ABL874_07640, partial [Sphingopyxis sp.]